MALRGKEYRPQILPAAQMGRRGLDTAYPTVANGPVHCEDSSVKTISLAGRTLPFGLSITQEENPLAGLQHWVISHKCS